MTDDSTTPPRNARGAARDRRDGASESNTPEPRLNRRRLLAATALGAAGLAAGCKRPSWDADTAPAADGIGAPAVTRRRRELKMVTTWPKNFPGLGTAPENFAKRVERATEGAITIRIFAAGELVPAFEAFDAASSGTADMYNGAEYYWQGKSKAFNFFTAVPFGLNAHEMDAWIHHGGGQQLWDELGGRFNIKPLPMGNSGVQMGGWFKREINTLEDFKGLKIRMPGLGGEVLRRMGAAAVAIPGGEIFQSLQTGAIDGTEWVGPWNDLAFGFYRVAPYYYTPGFHEPGSQLSLGINLDVWNSMSAGEQEIIRSCTLAETLNTMAEYNHRNAAALRTLVDEHNVRLRTFTDEIFTEMGRVSHLVLEELAESDDITQRVYASYRKARANGMEWGAISEEAYSRARRLYREEG